MATQLDTLKQALQKLQEVTSDPAILEAVQSIGEPEVFDEVYSSLRKMQHDMEQQQIKTADLEFDVSPVYGKHSGRPTFELVGMANNRRKELEKDNPSIDTGSFLNELVKEYKQAGEGKHETVTAYAEALTAKNEADTAFRVAQRQLYGAVAGAIEAGEIQLNEHRKNEHGEELSSYVLPAWLPEGIDIQNAQEIVYDEAKVMFWARSLNIWDVVSIDEEKLERFVKQDNADREGKRTNKYAVPIPAPVVILPKFKITIGNEVGYVPEVE